MTNIVLPALVLASAFILVVCVIAACVITCDGRNGLQIRDLFNGKFFEKYFSNLGDMLFSKCSFFILVGLTGVFIVCAFDASKSIEKEKRGECTCECKRCQEINKILKDYMVMGTNTIYIYRH